MPEHNSRRPKPADPSPRRMAPVICVHILSLWPSTKLLLAGISSLCHDNNNDGTHRSAQNTHRHFLHSQSPQKQNRALVACGRNFISSAVFPKQSLHTALKNLPCFSIILTVRLHFSLKILFLFVFKMTQRAANLQESFSPFIRLFYSIPIDQYSIMFFFLDLFVKDQPFLRHIFAKPSYTYRSQFFIRAFCAFIFHRLVERCMNIGYAIKKD